MSDESQQEISMQPDSSGEVSSDDESVPQSDTLSNYYYDNDIAGLIAENMYNLSVESDQDDDDDDDSNLSVSCDTPPQPFELNDDSEEDSEDSEVEENIVLHELGNNLVADSPLWYAQIRHFLTEREREDLWKKTPWVLKWYWDDSGDNGPSDHPLFKEQDSIGLF